MTRRFVAAFVAVGLTACCAAQKEPPVAQVPAELESGFLTNYADLTRGEKGRASFVYRAPALDVSGYGKILLDHVTLWRDAERGFGGIPDADLDRLAVRLFTDLWEALDADYEMVERAGARSVAGGSWPSPTWVAANARMDVYSADVDARDRVEHTSGALGDPCAASSPMPAWSSSLPIR